MTRPIRSVTRAAIAGCVVASFLPSGGATAATDDAWEAFRAAVAAECLAAAEPLFVTAEIVVDPFGSPSYGLALVRGIARGTADIAIMAICIYDKESQTAEIGGELPPFPGAKRL